VQSRYNSHREEIHVSKTLAKSATPPKPAAKKPVPKAAPARTANPAAKAKPAPAKAPAVPATRAVGAKPAVKAAAHPSAPSHPTAGDKGAPKVAPAHKVAPDAAAGLSTADAAASRFADRFAPPKPPARQYPDPAMDTLKHAVKADPKLANAWKAKAGRDLTEAELLAMPESEYMNDKQLEFFRARLTALKDDLLSNAGETTEHLREDTTVVPDPADRATIEEEHALELRTRDRERKLLKKIAQSLARIDAGDYGFCDETGEPIGLGRLLARPTATLSLEAQQRRELKQKMFGD
jgi:DnaK suppressor protein